MRGLEKIWIIGDNFCNCTFDGHYKNSAGPNSESNNQFYAFKNYEVREFSNNQYDSLFRNTAGRIRNSFLKAINEHNALPKLIVTILDDDLIQGMNSKFDFDLQLHVLTTWLVTEFEKAIATYKDFLPQRAKRQNFPHFLWIAPPTHCNFGAESNNLRLAQTKCLAEIVSTKKNMTMLKMIKVWEHEDRNAFLKDSYRLTSAGLDK